MAISGQTIRLEQQLRRQLAKITDQHVRELTRAWATAWDEVAADLQAALATAIDTENGATTAQLLKNARLQKSLTAIANQLEDLAQDAGVRITGDLRKVIDDAGAVQAQLIASQLPVPQDLVDLDAWSQVSERQISSIVRRSTERITAETRPLGHNAAKAVRQELIRGVAAGSNPRVVARRMVDRANGAFNGGLTRALNISRTEMLDAHRSAAALGQAQHTDVLQGWEWVASLGPRTCPACWGMHGSIHSLAEPGPMGHQGCRCARVPVTKPWSELGFDGIPEPPPLMVDADHLFASMSSIQQHQVLGTKRYIAWKVGKYPRSKWATRQRNPGWRDSMVPSRPPKVSAADLPKVQRRKPLPKAPTVPAGQRKDPLLEVPKINDELIANMEKRGIDVREWNRKATNPKFDDEYAFTINCQRVVQAYELRRRGFDVTAKKNPRDGSGRPEVFLKWLDDAEQRSIDSGRYWVTDETREIAIENGQDVLVEAMITDPGEYVREVVESWPEDARGWVMFWRDDAAGHIFNVENTADGLKVWEAQVPNGGGAVTLEDYMSQVKKLNRGPLGTLTLDSHGIYVFRVDDLEFNDGVLEAITWKPKTG